MADLIPGLANRRALRAFASQPVEPQLQALLWRAVSVAPSHGNTQPTRLLVTGSEEGRQRVIAALSEGNRSWAAAAPLFAAIVSIPAHDRPPRNRDGSEREMWAFETGIATGNLMVQATALGLIAHPMAGYDEPFVRAAFGAPPDVRILTVVAIGYPGDPATLPEDLRERENAPQSRIPLEYLVGVDHWRAEMGLSARDLRDR